MADEEKPINKLLALIVAALLAGAGGGLGIRVANDPRPDPFTGTQGRQLEQRIMRKIEKLEDAMDEHNKGAEVWKLKIQHNEDAIEHHLRRHP